ncbi:phage tail fiber protein [Enterobacter kobei]|uniref:phage tail fiber domain-containing protein n=1 Tax=Enterobacter kobei TaxID=208224 RepID=UPI0023798CD8|nr:phage tail fiber protein [Enterobacter kobei]MDD9222299.1 phage tail fiber protein [Enterobacter kobei]
MSVPNQTPYIIYNANGLTTVFPFEFYIINAGDIQVSINGTVVTSGYSVSGVGNVGGGDVTFITPPASGSVVMLERVVPTYRLTDYQDNGDLLADTVNKDFDRLWMAIQRSFIYLGLALRRPLLGGPFNAEGYRIAGLANPVDAQDAATKNYVDNVSLVRALRVPESSVGILPPADQRANKLLAFNALGQPITVVPQSGSASDVLIELAKPTGASLIGVQPQGNLAQMRPHITPEMFGAVGDGVTDDTLAIRAAFQAGSDLKIAVWGSGKTYGVTSTLWMQVNQPEIAYMNVDVIRPTASGELSELFSYKTASSARITVDFHHVYVTTNKKVRQVVVLDGTRRCKVHDCTFLDVDTPECYGIRLGISNNGYDNLYNDIYNNYITVGTDPDGGVGTVTRNGIVAFSNYADPVVGQTGGPDWAAYPPSVQYTRIYNNTVIGGTHNLHIRGCNVVDIFDNTLVGGSHRNINLSRMCQRIHIHDNMLLNAGSAAVVFGYCRWIKITDNYIYSGVVTAQGGDDSAIQFGEWVEELHIKGNTSLGDWVWGVHGETLRGGVIVDNIFEASRAAIAIETQWVATVPSGAAYSVPRNVPFKANTDTFDVKISGNKWKGVSGACGVYLSAFNGRQMQRVDVSDNFISNANMGHAFFLYEDTAGLIGNVRLHEHHAPGAQLANYSFNSNNALSSVSNVSGLTSLTKIITGSGDVAGYGTKSFSISGAFSVTNVLGPYIDGDSITIRGATGATLVQDTTKFRLRGAANAVFPDANGIIQLVRQSGLWFEQSRNF